MVVTSVTRKGLAGLQAWEYHPASAEPKGADVPEGHVENRREFLRQAGTVAWATPLILTLAAGRAGAQGISCAPAGTGCGTWSTPLDMCLPTGAVVCCNDCERGTGPQDMFCFCT